MADFEFKKTKSNFEQYKEQGQNQDAFRNAVRNKALPGLLDHREFDYDANQLEEHFNQKLKDSDFAMRTKYYFRDSDRVAQKAMHYHDLKEGQAKVHLTEQYAALYTNHNARKRKGSARKAEDNYNLMSSKMAQFANDQDQDSYTQYLHRETIMEYRLNAMLNAAEYKSKSKKNEAYLKARARLSCALILQDQLEHFIDDEIASGNKRLERKLNSKLSGIKDKIKSAKKDIIANVPRSIDAWREGNKLNSTTYSTLKKEYREESPLFSETDTRIFANLEYYQYQLRDSKWPEKAVLRDMNGAAVMKSEEENHEWNKAYKAANGDEKAAMEMEAVKRFESIPLPSAKDLLHDGARHYVMEHLRDYYDLTKRALPYYKEMVKKEGSVADYFRENKEIRARLAYVEAIDKYIDFKLRCDHNIEFSQKRGRFVIESDPNFKFYRDKTGAVKRKDAFGVTQNGRRTHQQEAEDTNIEKAFKKYTSVLDGSDILLAEGELLHNIGPVDLYGNDIINVDVSEEKQVKKASAKKEADGEKADAKKKAAGKKAAGKKADAKKNAAKKEIIAKNAEAIEKAGNVIGGMENLLKKEDKKDEAVKQNKAGEQKAEENKVAQEQPKVEENRIVLVNAEINNNEQKKAENKEENKAENKNVEEQPKEENKDAQQNNQDENNAQEDNLNKIAEDLKGDLFDDGEEEPVNQEENKEENKNVEQPKEENKEENKNQNEIKEENKEENKNQNEIKVEQPKEENLVQNKIGGGMLEKVEPGLLGDFKEGEIEKLLQSPEKPTLVALKAYEMHGNTIGAYNACPAYKEAIDKACDKFRKASFTVDSVDRIAATVMRPVKFDRAYKPIDEPENMKNFNWNMKWLRAWEEKGKEGENKVDEKTINEMISEEMDHLFDGYEMPPFPEKAVLSKEETEAYNKQLEAWFERTLEHGMEKWNELNAKFLSWDGLRRAWEPFNEFDKQNKFYNKYAFAHSVIFQVFGSYVKLKHNVDFNGGKTIVVNEANKKGAKEVYDAYYPALPGLLYELRQLQNTQVSYAEVLDDYKEGVESVYEDRIKYVPLTDKKKKAGYGQAIDGVTAKKCGKKGTTKVIDGKTFYYYAEDGIVYKLSENEDTEYNVLVDKQCDYLKAKKPKITRWAYDKYLKSKKASDWKFGNTDEYMVDRGRLTRFYVFPLKSFNTDGNGKPLTNKDREKFEWNKEYLKAVTGNEKDEKKKEFMTKSTISKSLEVLDSIQIPEELLNFDDPTAELDRKTEQKVINFVEALVDKMPGSIWDEIAKTHTSKEFSEQEVPWAAEFMKNNKRFDFLCDFGPQLKAVIDAVIVQKYGIRIDFNPDMDIVEESNARMDMAKEIGSEGSIISFLIFLSQHKNEIKAANRGKVLVRRPVAKETEDNNADKDVKKDTKKVAAKKATKETAKKDTKKDKKKEVKEEVKKESKKATKKDSKKAAKKENNKNSINVTNDKKESNKEENKNAANVINEVKESNKEENKNSINVINDKKTSEKKEDAKAKAADEKIRRAARGVAVDGITAEMCGKKGYHPFMGRYYYYAEDDVVYKLSSAENKEYSSAKKKEPRLTLWSYNLWRNYKKNAAFLRHPEYMKLYENTDSKKMHEIAGAAASSIDRVLTGAMKFVEFDKKGNPLPEYAKAHEWNLEFLRGFDKNKMSDSETQEKLDKMLADHIPHIFDDIMTYPIPDIFFNYPEGTEDEKVLDEVIRTCEMLVDRYGMKIFEANMRSLSLENVAKLKPVVDAYWKDNPKFQMLFDYSSNLYNLMVQIAQVKYGVNIAMGAKQIVNKQEGLSEKDKQNRDKRDTELVKILANSLLVFVGKYKAAKNTEYKREFTLTQKDIDNRLYIDNKTREKMRKEAPDVTDEAINYVKAFRDACVIKFYPEYAALMPKWPKGLYDKINYAREQMDRLAFTVMRPVKFDKYFKVIDEPENLANHEWNLKWLRAFVDENADNEKGTYKIDEKTINEMIEEEVGNIENLVNKMEMPPIPTKENPTDAELLEFQPRIAEWYRRVMTNSPDVFHQLGIKALGWDGLRKLSPAFKEWDQQNKYLFSIGDLCTNISGNSMYFDRVFFRINKEGDSIEKILETKEQRDANVAIYEEIQKNKKTIEVLYKACYNFGKERANKDKYPTFKQIVESMKKEEKK